MPTAGRPKGAALQDVYAESKDEGCTRGRRGPGAATSPHRRGPSSLSRAGRHQPLRAGAQSRRRPRSTRRRHLPGPAGRSWSWRVDPLGQVHSIRGHSPEHGGDSHRAPGVKPTLPVVSRELSPRIPTLGSGPGLARGARREARAARPSSWSPVLPEVAPQPQGSEPHGLARLSAA